MEINGVGQSADSSETREGMSDYSTPNHLRSLSHFPRQKVRRWKTPRGIIVTSFSILGHDQFSLSSFVDQSGNILVYFDSAYEQIVETEKASQRDGMSFVW